MSFARTTTSENIITSVVIGYDEAIYKRGYSSVDQLSTLPSHTAMNSD